MLELRDVSLRVGGDAHLSDISLQLQPGCLNVLLGPTRAGKTSLIRLIAGLESPTSGGLSLNGEDITARPVARRNVAMVYQQFINYPGWTVADNIASPLKVRRRPAAEIAREVERAADLLRLKDYLGAKPLELSGGQQQRVAIARALVKKADLVLLDEPLANLDYKLREDLRAELPRLFAGSGSVVVYATTEPAEALVLDGVTVAMREGRVIEVGPARSVYRQPQSLATARIVSDPPLNTLPVAQAADPGAFTGAATLAVRAHHVRLAPRSPASVSYDAAVESIEINGSESFVRLSLRGQSWVMLAHGVHAFTPGASLRVYVEPKDVMLFDAQGRRVNAMTQEA
jgi:glycerol transport system ATP-binding protein